jgi:hypothetical protein
MKLQNQYQHKSPQPIAGHIFLKTDAAGIKKEPSRKLGVTATAIYVNTH